MKDLIIAIPGDPLPQGSKTPVRNKHSGKLSVIDSNPMLAHWRMTSSNYMRQAAGEEQWEKVIKPTAVSVEVIFFLRRPLDHYGTGSRADDIKETAPVFHTKWPDVDKLARAILDAGTDAGLWDDDSQVSWLDVKKKYTDKRQPGAYVRVEVIEDA